MQIVSLWNFQQKGHFEIFFFFYVLTLHTNCPFGDNLHEMVKPIF